MADYNKIKNNMVNGIKKMASYRPNEFFMVGLAVIVTFATMAPLSFYLGKKCGKTPQRRCNIVYDIDFNKDGKNDRIVEYDDGELEIILIGKEGEGQSRYGLASQQEAAEIKRKIKEAASQKK